MGGPFHVPMYGGLQPLVVVNPHRAAPRRGDVTPGRRVLPTLARTGSLGGPDLHLVELGRL